jgi:hypothetical protein
MQQNNTLNSFNLLGSHLQSVRTKKKGGATSSASNSSLLAIGSALRSVAKDLGAALVAHL